MSPESLRAIYLTPGAGSMYCGSCLSDNMLVLALRRLGADVMLLPLYTPLRTEEPDQSESQIFYGGMSVYLRQALPWGDRLPRWLMSWLDAPDLLRTISRRAIRTDARKLGPLTLSMVRGEHGRQRADAERLVDWLASQPRMDVINFGTLLIAGCVPLLKRKLNVPIVVTLQGDDLFLDDLPQPYREQVETQLRRIARDVDGFIVHSHFYAEEMGRRFEIPPERLHVVPLGIAESRVLLLASARSAFRDNGDLNRPPPRVGYLARICPAKGLHVLVDAFVKLRAMPGMAQARLHVGGWLGPDDKAYFRQQENHLVDHGLAGAFEYHDLPDWGEKAKFLRDIDVLSVPTTYHEPKGRFVLEALAAGVPVVQPRHGAFPELLASTGGGLLIEPGDATALATALYELLSNPVRRLELGAQGRAGVLAHHTDEHAAVATLEVYQRCIRRSQS